MKVEEATREELMYLSLWDKWTDEMAEAGRKGLVVSDRLDDLLIAYFECNGVKPPTKGSPICLMFRGFVAGMEMGVEVMMDLEQDEKEEKP